MAEHNCKLSFLSRSDGSALYTLGDTVILTSVHGPGDVKISNRIHNALHLDVCFSPRTGTSNIKEKATESVIAQTVKQTLLSYLHPRTGITLTIQEMQSSGLTLAASINASCLALLDAGVQMNSTFVAVTCCFTKENLCIIEPSQIEIEESESVLTFIFDGNKLEVLSTHQDGSFDCDQLSSSLLKCREAAKVTLSFYRTIVEDKYKFFNVQTI